MKQERLTTLTIVWEDNDACRMLATSGDLPKITPRNKHFGTEMHWFKDHLKEGQIEVHRVDTKLQRGDIFTKGLGETEFEPKREMIMGWIAWEYPSIQEEVSHN